ncbi:MAG: DUF1365 domain-containing protein, partial [bacterium]
MNNQIFEGWVRHRRFNETNHSFEYNLFMVFIDISQLPELFDEYRFWSSHSPNLAWFQRTDHFGNPDTDLASAVRNTVEQKLGRYPEGPIYLLTHLRYFGFCFNPISVYYCFEPDSKNIDVLLCEVHNTPWGERHCYVLDTDDA